MKLGQGTPSVRLQPDHERLFVRDAGDVVDNRSPVWAWSMGLLGPRGIRRIPRAAHFFSSFFTLGFFVFEGIALDDPRDASKVQWEPSLTRRP
jgi:hypothetical protein